MIETFKIKPYNQLEDNSNLTLGSLGYTGREYPRLPSDLCRRDVIAYIASKFYGSYPRPPFYIDFDGYAWDLTRRYKGEHYDLTESLLNKSGSENAKEYFISCITCDQTNNDRMIDTKSDYLGVYIKYDEIRALKSKTNITELLISLYENENANVKRVQKLIEQHMRRIKTDYEQASEERAWLSMSEHERNRLYDEISVYRKPEKSLNAPIMTYFGSK